MNGIIIGGGIGGLTAAIALRQKGISVKVFEAAPEIKEAGAGIWVATNAMNVLERLKLADEVRAAGFPLKNVSVTDTYDNTLQSIPLEKIRKKYGNVTIAIHRGRLQQLLYNQLGSHVVSTGKRFVRYEEDEEGVVAWFEDGTSHAADFIIGADGIHSRVRTQVVGEMPLRYSGQTCWRGICDLRLPEKYASACTEIWGEGKGLRAGFSEIGSSETYFYLTVHASEGGTDTAGEIKEELKVLYRRFPPIVTELISACDENKIIRTDLHDIPPFKTWSKGRAVLLGDAAHATNPNLGQGACQAIEDAYVIADCLLKSDTIEDAFLTYRQIRMAKAHMIVKRSYQIAQLLNIGNPWLIRLRNLVMRNVPSKFTEGQFDEIYGLNY